MPKKTKKEKLLAAYRKQLRQLKENKNLSNSEVPAVEEIKEKPVEKKVDLKKNNEQISEDIVLSKYFYMDFRKSLVFIVLIIALEIGLYFAKLIK